MEGVPVLSLRKGCIAIGTPIEESVAGWMFNRLPRISHPPKRY
jgi:hypothetical protein